MNNDNYFDIKDLVYTKENEHIQIFFIISPKGIGKTYSAIQFCFDEWEKYQKGFAFIFRTMEEVKSFIPELMGEMNNERYVRKGVFIMEKSTNLIIGVLGSITTHHKIKNNPLIYNLIFDEVIPQNYYYISQEYMKFFKIVDNLSRLKSGINVIMLANPNDANNIYFIKWKIYDFNNKRKIIIDDKILILFIKSGEYVNQLRRKSIGYFLAKYDKNMQDTLIGGEFALNDMRLIDTREEIPFQKYWYKVILNQHELIVGIDNNGFLAFDRNDKIKGLTEIVLTSKDALEQSNYNLSIEVENTIQPWITMILAKKATFRDFEIKEMVITFLSLVSGRYKLGN